MPGLLRPPAALPPAAKSALSTPSPLPSWSSPCNGQIAHARIGEIPRRGRPYTERKPQRQDDLTCARAATARSVATGTTQTLSPAVALSFPRQMGNQPCERRQIGLKQGEQADQASQEDAVP